jgi:hypothetical protein
MEARSGRRSGKRRTSRGKPGAHLLFLVVRSGPYDGDSWVTDGFLLPGVCFETTPTLGNVPHADR